MNNRLLKAGCLAVIAFLSASAPLLAHHGNAQYEPKTLTLKGTVTAWQWINPHVFIKVDVKDDKGEVTNWIGELVAPSNMINFGFTKETFKPGDEVTLVTSDISRLGAPVARLSQIILANGQVMKTAGKYDGNAAAAADHKANAAK